MEVIERPESIGLEKPNVVKMFKTGVWGDPNLYSRSTNRKIVVLEDIKQYFKKGESVQIYHAWGNAGIDKKNLVLNRKLKEGIFYVPFEFEVSCVLETIALKAKEENLQFNKFILEPGYYEVVKNKSKNRYFYLKIISKEQVRIDNKVKEFCSEYLDANITELFFAGNFDCDVEVVSDNTEVWIISNVKFTNYLSNMNERVVDYHNLKLWFRMSKSLTIYRDPTILNIWEKMNRGLVLNL